MDEMEKWDRRERDLQGAILIMAEINAEQKQLAGCIRSIGYFLVKKVEEHNQKLSEITVSDHKEVGE